jgi:predicted Zn-dependent peptidase
MQGAVRDALRGLVEATLPNGLKIRLLPNRTAPIASVYTFFKVGSRNEQPGITGISHLFEHMMFNGSKKYGPKQFDRVLESHGGRSNAYTTHDMTVYHEEVAAEALEIVFDLESDRMGSLLINDATLESEREVVKEERRLRVDNEPAGLLDEELGALIWKAHPYRWPVIGWMGDIENIGREDCERYFRTFYAPNNAALYVVGDFDPHRTLSLIRRYYGRIRSGPPVPPVVNSEPEQRGERRALVRHAVQAPSMMVGYHAPRADQEDALALDVLQYALTVGDGSRLVRSLVFEQPLAVAVVMDWGWRIDPGAIVFYLELKPDSKPERVEQALYQQLEKVCAEGLSARELTKAKNNLKSHLLQGLATNSGKAQALGSYELLLGDWQSSLDLAIRYDAITAEQVRAVSERYLRPEKRSVTTLLPTGGRP